MIYQLILDESSIYDDIGDGDGLVQEVDWAIIGKSGIFGIMRGGTQIIDDNNFEVLSVFEHPESSSLWFYAKHCMSGQIYRISLESDVKYSCGLDGKPEFEDFEDFDRDDLPF